MKLTELKKWSDERGLLDLNYDRNAFNANITEELGEKLKGHKENNEHEVVDAICDVSVFSGNEIYKIGYETDELLGCGDIKEWLIETDYELSFVYGDEITYLQSQILETDVDSERVKYMKNMVIVSYQELVNIGYDPDKCMNEVMKELNSRKGAYSEEAGKWKKFKDPESVAAWYKADFTNCKF